MTGFTKGPELSLVERLRARAEMYDMKTAALIREAADALAEQAAVREELCGALRHITRWLMTDVDALPPHVTRDDVRIYHLDGAILHNCLERARAALAKAAPEKEHTEGKLE